MDHNYKFVSFRQKTPGDINLIILPGLGCNSEDFETVIPSNYGAIFVDYKDYQQSGTRSTGSFNDISMEIISFLSGLPLSTKVIFVSHSMGSIIAAMISEGYSTDGWINMEGNMVEEDCFFSRRVVGYSLEEFIQTGFSSLLNLFRKAQAINGTTREYIKSLERVNPYALWHHAEETVNFTVNGYAKRRFMEYLAPRRYIVGEYTKQNSAVKKMLDINDMILTIPGAGHFIMKDNPRETKLCLEEFIKNI